MDLSLTRRLVLRLLEWEATAVTNSPDDDSADAELKQLLRAALAAGANPRKDRSDICL